MVDDLTTPIKRQSGENDFEYHKRIIEGKLVDKTLSDYDYSELAKYAYGKDYSCDVARRMFYGSAKTLELIDKENINKIESPDVISEIDRKMLELKKEKQKCQDQRAAYNKVIRDQSRWESLCSIIDDAIENSSLPRLERREISYATSDNDILVSLSDIHYGMSTDNYWCKYNSDICRDMMSYYASEIINIGSMHKSQRCIICENGDAISGSIHKTIQLSNKENVIDQVVGVSELIAEFISILADHFSEVQFVSVSGNHSRIDARKEDSLMSERLDDLIEWYLKARLQNYDNVVIGAGDKIDHSMYLIDIRGKTYIGVHGDYDKSNSDIQSLQIMAGKPIYAVLYGHLHHNKCDEVQGIKTLMSGSFCGMDEYCVGKRIYGKPQQMVCICNNDGILCHYDIDLSKY